MLTKVNFYLFISQRGGIGLRGGFRCHVLWIAGSSPVVGIFISKNRKGDITQLVRVSALQVGSRRFDSDCLHYLNFYFKQMARSPQIQKDKAHRKTFYKNEKAFRDLKFKAICEHFSEEVRSEAR